MAKKLDFKSKMIICAVATLLGVALALSLWLLSAISLTAFIVLLIIFLLAGGISSFSIYLIRKNQLKKIALKKKLEQEEKDRKLRELYNILGIELQYNDDGSIKDLYKLLGIEPKYDENGIRMLTPYELMAIHPIFDDHICEVPNVFVIKNRAIKVARGIEQAPVFTFKPQVKSEQVKKPEAKKVVLKPKGKGKKSSQTIIKIKPAKPGKPVSNEKLKFKPDKKMGPIVLPKISLKKDSKVKIVKKENKVNKEKEVETKPNKITKPETKQEVKREIKPEIKQEIKKPENVSSVKKEEPSVTKVTVEDIKNSGIDDFFENIKSDKDKEFINALNVVQQLLNDKNTISVNSFLSDQQSEVEKENE